MPCFTFFTAGFAAGVAGAGAVVVTFAFAFIALPGFALTDLFDDLTEVEVLSGAFAVVDVVAGVVLVDLPSAARAGAVNNEAASNAAEICFNMVSSCFQGDDAGNALPVRPVRHHAPRALNPP
jgi:hypothetical protein